MGVPLPPTPRVTLGAPWELWQPRWGMEPLHTSPATGSARPEAPCCGAGKGPYPSLSVTSSATCGLRLELPEGSGHAGGLPPGAISPHPTRCNPGKAPRPLPLSAFPLARRPWAGGGSCATGWGPTALLLTPERVSSGLRAPTLPPNCAPQPVQHHGPVSPPASALPQPHPAGPSVTQPALTPWQPPPHASSCPSPSEAPPPGWPGPMALAAGALQGRHPASCPHVPSQGRDLWACESDSEPKGNREHCHGGTSAPSLISGRGRCPG